MKRQLVFILFYIAAPLLLIARVLQQFWLIDPKTGFYIDGSGSFGAVITVMCFALIFALLLLVWLARPEKTVPPVKSLPLSIGAYFAAFCLTLSGASAAVTTNGVRGMIVALLAFATAISMAWYATSMLTGIKYPRGLSVVGIAYGIGRLIITFMSYTGEVTVTDTLFDIATMCLLVLFLYSSGKLICGVGTPRTTDLFYSYGLSAAFFCTDGFLAKTVALLTGNSAAIYNSGVPDLSYVGFAVYIIVMIHVFSAQRKAD